MNLFNLSVSSAELHFSLEGAEQRAHVPFSRSDNGNSGKPNALPLFRKDESIRGLVTVKVAPGKRLEHTGLKVQLVGVIEVPVDGRIGHEFLNSFRELQPRGELSGESHFAFEFAKTDKIHESYEGTSVKVRYVLRATLTRGKYASRLVHEQDLWVQHVAPCPRVNQSIKMEVGIDDWLEIEFAYDKSHYHLEDVVIGTIFFLVVRIKIKHMELAIVRRESVGAATQRHHESATITTFELVDGAPVKNESVPVRFYLAPYALTPTYTTVPHRFTVKYFLNLVLLDHDDRRYFKQQEITLWRQTIG